MSINVIIIIIIIMIIVILIIQDGSPITNIQLKK